MLAELLQLDSLSTMILGGLSFLFNVAFWVRLEHRLTQIEERQKSAESERHDAKRTRERIERRISDLETRVANL